MFGKRAQQGPPAAGAGGGGMRSPSPGRGPGGRFGGQQQQQPYNSQGGRQVRRLRAGVQHRAKCKHLVSTGHSACKGQHSLSWQSAVDVGLSIGVRVHVLNAHAGPRGAGGPPASTTPEQLCMGHFTWDSDEAVDLLGWAVSTAVLCCVCLCPATGSRGRCCRKLAGGRWDNNSRSHTKTSSSI